MRNKIFKYRIILIISLILCSNKYSAAQHSLSGDESTRLREKTIVITDREVYCVNEYIKFKACNISPDSIKNTQWSSVLYIEIITNDGRPVIQKKFNYNSEGTSGIIFIPHNVISGNYYLRAYTKWMRNYSPACFFNKVIKIVNPYNNKVLSFSSPDLTPGKYITETGWKISDSIHISTDRKSYKKRDTAEVSVKISGEINVDSDFSISVIKKGLHLSKHITAAKEDQPGLTPEYIPETRALSISGKILNETDSIPLPYQQVNLTVFKEKPEIISTLSTKEGKFFFDLSQLWGEYEIFISSQNKNRKENRVILIDNDFSSKKTELPYFPFNLTVEERVLYNELSLNSQLQHIYNNETAYVSKNKTGFESMFYGKPDFTLKLDEFIELPTMDEYFHELIPYVAIRQSGKKKSLKVLGHQSDLRTFEPLVLVDMVAISDIDKILQIPPGRIERIEIIDQPFVRGSITYGGIISFISKDGNLAGIDLPSSGIFFKYKMYASEISTTTSEGRSKRIPDLRNCLYWNPSVRIDGSSDYRFTFKTGDTKGEYLVVIKTVDNSGRILASFTNFFVE